MKIIDGASIAKGFLGEVAQKASQFEQKNGRKVGLAVICVGDDPASKIYVGKKIDGCKANGLVSFAHILKESTTEQELLRLIEQLNNDNTVDGILVQLPLPKHIDEQRALAAVDYRKDVDGFHAINQGRLLMGQNALCPCTAIGCIELIKSTGQSIAGKNAVVIGRSNIVGKPLAVLLMHNHATVTICHSRTRDLKEHTKNADILVAALGKPKFVTADMVKEGAIVIDVGINRVDGKLCGDVDFEAVAPKCAFITPVPGGVGPMTIAMLLNNTIIAAKSL